MAGLASSGCIVQVLDCGDSAVRVVVEGPSEHAAWRVAHGLAALLRQSEPDGLLGTLHTYEIMPTLQVPGGLTFNQSR